MKEKKKKNYEKSFGEWKELTFQTPNSPIFTTWFAY